MNDDAALLRRYVDERSEAALGELVRLHLDLVHATALRRSDGDSCAAEVISREVFSRLAREAASVSRQSIVVAWLHAATRRGGAMPAVSTPPAGGEIPAGRWQALHDDALDDLPEADRSALLLHYFERRPLAEVGVALNLSEQAAGLCTRRALDKLRAALAKRGVRLGPAMLTAIMADEVVALAPAGLAEKVTSAAVVSATAAEVAEEGNRTFRGAIMGMINSGAALGTVAVIAIGGMLAWGYRTNTRLEAEIARVFGESQDLAGLQRDSRRLARLVVEADELRREVAELPALRAAIQPTGTSPPTGTVALTIAREGSFLWEREDVGPAELIQRLREFRALYPSPDSSVIVRTVEAPVSAVLYVLDEIRKAQITQVHVDGEPSPAGGAGAWF